MHQQMDIWDQADPDLESESAYVVDIEVTIVIVVITITVLGVDHVDAVEAGIIITENADDLDLWALQEDENSKGIYQ